MYFLNEDPHKRILRRLSACTHTLYAVAEELDDFEDEEMEDPEKRGDLLIAVENLIDVATHLTDEIRAIAWQHTLTPQQIEEQDY